MGIDLDAIKEMDWRQLNRLWARIKRRRDRSVSTPKGGKSDGKELEHLVVRGFQLSGAEVVWPFMVKTRGTAPHVTEQLDGAVHVEHLSCIIECKDHRADVKAEPVAKLQAQLRRRPPATVGIVFSSRSFTPGAVYTATFGAGAPVLLWPGSAIDRSLSNEDFAAELRMRYRYFVEQSLPYMPSDSAGRILAEVSQ